MNRVDKLFFYTFITVGIGLGTTFYAKEILLGSNQPLFYFGLAICFTSLIPFFFAYTTKHSNIGGTWGSNDHI